MEEPERSATDATAPRRGIGVKGWALTAVAALALGAAAGYATFSGAAAAVMARAPGAAHGTGTAHQAPAFLELDQMTITVGDGSASRQLRFRAFLQLGAGGEVAVAALEPRILDIFATYLRAVPVATLEDPTGLMALRAQLLRRVQLLAGADAVQDLLIIDFVIA